MWVIAGLACTALACVWQAPALGSRFESARACQAAVARIGPMDTVYFVLECRRADKRNI